jgi:O-antigen/teichoic acid export membrane protein
MSHGKTAFFRQSSWMIFATAAGGACMFAVHPFSKKIPESEYGVFGTMLAVLNCMTIPSLGLRMIFAQQAAAAITDEQKRKLTGTTRGVLLGTFGIWLLFAAIVMTFHRVILDRWQISNPTALWLMLVVGLCAIWSPVFSGILQGQQNFLWLGWASILEAMGRLAGVAVIVLIFQGYAAGMVVGILLGMSISSSIAVWHTRTAWRGPSAPFEWRPWLARVVPITLGFGSFQFMYGADPLFVQAYFDKNQTAFYIAAGTLSRALVQFTGAIVAVMYPKIVRSVARAEKTDVMTLTLITTAVLGALGAVGLTLVAPWVLRLVYKEAYLAGTLPLLPWFAWSMVPLALANVLVNNLLAREQFRIVPWLVAIAAAYGFALTQFHGSFLTVIKTIGVFSLGFLGVGVWFTWRKKK